MARKKASKEEAPKVTMDVVVTDELEGVTEESKETKEALTEEEKVVKEEETVEAPVKQEEESVKQEESIEESEESIDKGVLSVLEIYPEYESLYVSKTLGVYDPKTFKESIDPTAKLYKNPHYKK